MIKTPFPGKNNRERGFCYADDSDSFGLILVGKLKLGELFGRPFGDALILDHAEEVASVETRILTVLEELAENLSTGGSRTAAEAAFGIEKLVIRCLEFVLQNGRLEDQQLSGIVVIFGAVRGIEQAEILPRLPSLIDKEIRQSGVRLYAEVPAHVIARDEEALCLSLIHI